MAHWNTLLTARHTHFLLQLIHISLIFRNIIIFQPLPKVQIKGLELHKNIPFRHLFCIQTPPNPQKKTLNIVTPCDKIVYIWF